MDFFFDNLEGRLSSTLPHYDRPDGDEQDCRTRARDAEWNFRVSKGYVKDPFWNRLWFRLPHGPHLSGRRLRLRPFCA